MASPTSLAHALALVVLVLASGQGYVAFVQGLDQGMASLVRHPFAAEQNFLSTTELQEGLNSGRTLQAASKSIGQKVCTTNRITPVTMPLDPESLAAIPALPTPKSCSEFRTADLLGGCQTDLNIDEGCCTPSCGEVLGKMEVECWNDFVADMCESSALRVVPFMEKLTERCHMIPQPIDCKVGLDKKPKASPTSKESKPKTTSSKKKKAKSNSSKRKSKKTVETAPEEVEEVVEQVAEEPSVPKVKKCLTKKECKAANKLLFVAVNGGDVNMVQEQLLKGADIEGKDEQGWTPLIVAAWKGRVDIVQYLLKEGAKIDAENDDGSTALIEASYWGHPSVVEVLLEGGAKVNGKGEYGATPLFWAGLNGHAMIADILINAGAKVNARDKNGSTPLHWAAGLGKEYVVQSLINAGANKKAVDGKGQSVHDVTCEHGFCTVDIKFNILGLLGKRPKE